MSPTTNATVHLGPDYEENLCTSKNPAVHNVTRISSGKIGASRKYMRTGEKMLLRTGLVPARAWGGQAVGIAPTERLKLRRQVAAAAGKKESVSLSLFMEVNNFEVEEELFTVATLAWVEGVWLGRWRREQQKAWRKQIPEAQTWRQVRGLAGAVMCETRDLGIKVPQGHVGVDMRVVCPQDVMKMLLKQARMVDWKKSAAKSEHEELKGGVSLDPIQAMLRRKINDVWTDKHRKVTRKLVVEGG